MKIWVQIPSTYEKMPGVFPALPGEARQIPRAHWPGRLVEPVSSGFSERLISKNRVEGLVKGLRGDSTCCQA